MPKSYGYVLNYIILTTHSSHHYLIWNFTCMYNQHCQDVQYNVVREMLLTFSDDRWLSTWFSHLGHFRKKGDREWVRNRTWALRLKNGINEVCVWTYFGALFDFFFFKEWYYFTSKLLVGVSYQNLK